MSTDTESLVFGSHGPVNTGTGNQINGPAFFFDFDRVLQRFVRVRDPRVVAQEYLRWLSQRFVEPRHYGRSRELLVDTGSVLLAGAPGSGRRSAALMLLHRMPGADDQIRELSGASDTSEASDELVLDGSAVDAEQRLLLDLSTSEEKDYNTVLRELPFFRAVVHERGARLVVVLPYSRMHHSNLELGPSAVEIARPDGKEVFQRYLRSDRIPFSREQLSTDELTAQLHSAPMQHIAELAGLVHLARESEPAQKFPHWLREALAALTERSDQVAKQMMMLRSGQQRALLLTTAMFSGAQADAVFDATSTLCKIVRHPEDDRPRLEREDLAEQLAEIGAKADDAGRVRFALLAYDRAVRTYFWTNFPDLREGFRDWVGTAIEQRTLTSEDRDAVVTWFAEQALRTGRPGDLLRLVERWVKRTDAEWPSTVLPQAAKALERGLSHERHGAFFRHQLYTWSRDRNLPRDLAQVVVQVCSEVLALTHPEQAMVRLHHIVRRHSSVAGDAARDALLDLVDHDHRLYLRLLDRATNGPGAKEGTVADLALFLELAAPTRLTDTQRRKQPLIASAAVRGRLVTGWKAELAEPSSLHCADHVRTWLAACEDGRYHELLLDVLVSAGGGQDDVLSRLYVIARDWAHAPGDRRAERIEIAAHLTSKIDSAQGFDFTDPDLGHRTEETSP